MMRILNAGEPGFKEALEDFKTRATLEDELLESKVREILQAVRRGGDQAVKEFTHRFDGVALKDGELAVTAEEIKKAHTLVSRDGIDAIKVAMDRIHTFHDKQRRNSWFYSDPFGNILGQLITPLERVGIYVPGGKAPYPSTVLMCAIPARIAGVKEVYCASPPQIDGSVNPYILVAADMAGVDKVFKVGGVQAIAAFSYGTGTIPRVDKIVGPGNIYVTLAKKLVFGQVSIDMLAGPSEILVIADEEAPPHFIAADLLSQAEHDERASTILITTSRGLIDKVSREIEQQLNRLKRRETCIQALKRYGLMILTDSLDQAFDLANQIGPEHLEIAVRDPFPWLSRVSNAGSIFLGYHTPEPLGDYIAGPNHVLPTGGTAHFFSSLGVDDFTKRSGVSYYSKRGLEHMGRSAVVLTEIEGLDAHGRSIQCRLRGD